MELRILSSLRSFLRSKERKASPKTMNMYRSYVKSFEAFLNNNRIESLVPMHLEDFLGNYPNKNTQAGYKRFLKMFCRFIGRVDLLEYIRDNMRDIKGVNRFKVDLTPIEILRLIDVTERIEFKFGWSLAAFQGFRAGTILGFHYEDVDVNTPSITLRKRPMGDGARDPYGPKGWKPDHEPQEVELNDISLALFKQLPRGEGRIIRCSYKTLRKHFNRAVEESGLSRKEFHVTLHKLRHFYGHFWDDNGGNIRVLKEVMGHSTIAYTELYTAPTDVRIIEESRRIMKKITEIM